MTRTLVPNPLPLSPRSLIVYPYIMGKVLHCAPTHHHVMECPHSFTLSVSAFFSLNRYAFSVSPMVGVMLLEGGIGCLPWQANTSPSGDLGLWEAASVASILLYQCQAFILWEGFHSQHVLSNRNIVATPCLLWDSTTEQNEERTLVKFYQELLWLILLESQWLPLSIHCFYKPWGLCTTKVTLCWDLGAIWVHVWGGLERQESSFLQEWSSVMSEALVDMASLPQMVHTMFLSSVGLRSSCPQCWLVH